MNDNAEKGLLGTGPSREDSAGGEAAAIVAQVRRRREAAGRCEPLDCGHQDPHDCDAAQCGKGVGTTDTPHPEPADVDPDAITELWANAKAAWTIRDFPKYGSREWIALTPDDPRRLAGALEAAELWRKFGDEEELIAWLKNLGRRPNLVDTRSRAELDELAKPKPPHQLQATPGWPPIRVPGQPGRYLECPRKEAA
ncbi:hypothetical protein [Streptomyces sp. NBC_00582]|uniref:hypothetical protein n=1 Tax=Streptomyces sp. NBC_00582 TaxID=2975783 RepID=UPI002E80639D|nr:hypothetical protein [Streptomyces sp. NBC_00582]WUB60442.1 hypothetical protein OG852_08620 [Streptomyces sp. NBC_00582]